MKKALIIGQNGLVLGLLEASLHLRGFSDLITFVCCKTADEALEAIRRADLELAFIDQSLVCGEHEFDKRLMKGGNATSVVSIALNEDVDSIVARILERKKH